MYALVILSSRAECFLLDSDFALYRIQARVGDEATNKKALKTLAR
jgi:hypothetical protein